MWFEDFTDIIYINYIIRNMKPRLYISLLMMGTALKAFPQISLTDKYANSFPLADGKTCAAICYDKEDALVVDKPTFGSAKLAHIAAQLAPEEIELVGVCTDICVISNAMLLKAALPETRITVDAACCAGVTAESHENALRAMEACQVEVCR